MNKLLSCVDEVIAEWDFTRIMFSHGSPPFVDNDPRMESDAGGSCSAKEAFARAWYVGLGRQSQRQQQLNGQSAGAVPAACS